MSGFPQRVSLHRFLLVFCVLLFKSFGMHGDSDQPPVLEYSVSFVSLNLYIFQSYRGKVLFFSQTNWSEPRSSFISATLCLDPVHRCDVSDSFLTNEIHINYCKSSKYLLKAICQLEYQIRLRIFNIFRQVIGFGQKTRIGDWSSSEPMQWDLSPSGQLGFHDLNQAVEFRQLLLSLARKSAGISISLGAVLLHHFCKGEATVGRFRCADLRY